jgi:hypothetical protein
MWLWPAPLSPTYDVTGMLVPAFAASLLVVFAVLAALLVRMGRGTRRAIRTVTCPEDRRPALILVKRTADREAVADCSRWHDRRLDCGGQCLEPRTGTDG